MIKSNNIELDTKDVQILNILQKDSTTSIQAIAEQIGLTNNPCWRRVKRLQEVGVIAKYTIALDRKKIGLGTTAFVTLRIESHNIAWLDIFAECIHEMPEIVECHRMTGDVDYILKVVVQDLNHYDRVYRELVDKVSGLIDVSSTFSMEEIKADAQIDTSTIVKANTPRRVR
ncbi:MAG: Lrp/AsnC family transcriptional regulator [Arenicella sp.]|jgi:Lrp/AsnC family transcriptional regulator